jgi:hypothetical protein
MGGLRTIKLEQNRKYKFSTIQLVTCTSVCRPVVRRSNKVLVFNIYKVLCRSDGFNICIVYALVYLHILCTDKILPNKRVKLYLTERTNLQTLSLHFNIKGITLHYNLLTRMSEGIIPGILPLEQVLGILSQILNQLIGIPSQIREGKATI